MSRIDVNNLTFYYEGSYENIFENVSFQIDTDWKLGFIGRNGRGKTTFLNLLLGKYEYVGTISKSVEFDYFPYQVKDKTRQTIEIVEEIYPQYEFWELCREWAYLKGTDDVWFRPFDTLSHGEQTKVMLAVLFLKENHFLLIDEPTNHLDMETRQLVCDYLKRKKGFILVSHDRTFLDGCIDHVLSINKNNIEVVAGNFSSWWENKQRQDAFELAENEKLKKDIRRLSAAARQAENWADKVESTKIGRKSLKYEKSIDTRAYVGEKSRRMQSRRKNLERRREAELEEKSKLLKNIESQEDIRLVQAKHHKDLLIEAKDLALYYGEKEVCRGISFELHQGDCLVLEGHNGCGKSSIIKAVLQAAGGKREPEGATTAKRKREPEGAKATGRIAETEKTDRILEIGETKRTLETEGKLELASGLKISYVSQDTSYLRGSLQDYICLEKVDETLFKQFLRKMDFSRGHFEKRMEDFSEGQKKKVLLARSLCDQAHVYIWDEPLNFIDIFSRMQLEDLIVKYRPTMILVEHDRTFVEKVQTKVIRL